MNVDSDQVGIRKIRDDDGPWLVRRHAELYAENDGFDDTFGPLVADIVNAYLRQHDPATECGWIAHIGPRRLGSIFCVQSGDPGVAKLRLFLLEPDARGLGLGRRLMETCLRFARDSGFSSMRLWTHQSHEAACVLYAKYGFRCVTSQNVHSFGQDLVEQTWELDLT